MHPDAIGVQMRAFVAQSVIVVTVYEHLSFCLASHAGVSAEPANPEGLHFGSSDGPHLQRRPAHGTGPESISSNFGVDHPRFPVHVADVALRRVAGCYWPGQLCGVFPVVPGSGLHHWKASQGDRGVYGPTGLVNE